MRPATRRRLRFLVGFSAYFAALWLLWETPLVYPLKVFVVFLHEISHGVVALATGGAIHRITLSPRLGGACHCPGGNAFLTLSAGYLGSLLWGGLILEAGRRAGRRADRVVHLVGGATVLITLLFVRGAFGMAFGVLFGVALLLAARSMSNEANRTLLNVLGLTSCLYAVLDIKADILDRPLLESDAAMLGDLTGIPTLVWGVLWITIAVVVSSRLFVRAYRAA